MPNLQEIERVQTQMEQMLKEDPRDDFYREASEHHKKLMAEIRRRQEWWRDLPPRRAAYAYLGKIAGELGIPPNYREYVITMALNDMYSYGKIQHLIDDPLVSDIQIYGEHFTFYIKEGKRYISTEGYMDNEEVLTFVQKKLSGTNYRFDMTNPSTDAILPDGYRMHVVGGPAGWTLPEDEDGRRLEKDCLIVTIRKPLRNFTLQELLSLHVFDEKIYLFFQWMQRLARSFVVVGGTGSSKSTLMAALLGLIPPDRMSCVIEEMPELQPLCAWAARLYERAPNAEGRGAVRMAQQIVNTLRMMFDNVYIGEVRTSIVLWEFFQAAATVTYQTATTLHVAGFANAGAAIRRMAALLSSHESRPSTAMVGDLISMSVRHIISMRSVPERGGKRVVEIAEVLPYEPREQRIPYVTLAKWDPRTDSWVFHGITEQMAEEAALHGHTISELPILETPNVQYVYL
ncbi:CpaF family protein [Alicyclobacillus acidocaldarius]|uniref:Type II secretion system protein E n=1 Tax=Alicyclobacillus acidocaldarius (strain Tc-4-1) TaxID=1048834 RepID=F8IL79_ALIAT|nr:ATPase, T2SS/T4P/T4SS family [Alicyclobacillus acidocaldarius]AEJ43645.1 type II secretion system protein E [Alicyclobacillus acidocaldarius subsp. acidocaldarius Tc-4-1]